MIARRGRGNPAASRPAAPGPENPPTAALPRVRCAWALALALAFAGAGEIRAQEAPARGPVTDLPMPRFVSLRADSANARRGPSLDQRIDWAFLRRGLPLQITAEYGQWRRVRDAEGAGGWVHQSLLSGARTALVRTGAPAPLRAGPAEGAAIRALAEPGVIARLRGCGDAWCEVAADGVAGWLPRAALWGVLPGETFE